MKEKHILLIDKQIEKLSEADFNLEAWKSATIYLLRKIFGETDAKIREIDNLKIDYSSWALRDSDSKYQPIENCKRKGREILEIAKDEIELFGLENPIEKLTEKLKLLLPEAKYKAITSPESSEQERVKILKTIDKEKLAEMVNELLINI